MNIFVFRFLSGTFLYTISCIGVNSDVSVYESKKAEVVQYRL